MLLWIKALHLIAVICWFAGLFYLPRLFVYHAGASDLISQERFKVMERRLFRGIMTPAMLATLILGIWLLWLTDFAWLRAGWMHAKLLCVLLLVGYHHACLYYMKKFASGTSTRSSGFFRAFNEAPTVLLLAIVILAVVKPF